MERQPLSDSLSTQLIQASNIESQDHFCWSWSLLYLHSKVMGISLRPLRQWLKQTRFPQVAIIKMYTWLCMTWLNLDSSFPSDLREDYFCIWDAVNRLDPKDYRRYNLLFGNNLTLQSVDACLETVLTPGIIIVQRTEAITPVPSACLV